MAYYDSSYEKPPVYKKYVDVLEVRHKDGTLEPKAILWNGKAYKIEKYEFNHQYASSRAGGGGKFYRIYMNGRKRNMYLEKDKWFLETSKNPHDTQHGIHTDLSDLDDLEL